MPASKAHIKASNKFNKKAYYRPSICLRREYEEMLREKADKKSLSVSGYILELIKKDLGVTE